MLLNKGANASFRSRLNGTQQDTDTRRMGLERDWPRQATSGRGWGRGWPGLAGTGAGLTWDWPRLGPTMIGAGLAVAGAVLKRD